MDVSLGALRQRLLNFRSWDSSGETLDNRIREAMNTALDRLAGDVPEALIPDEQHVVLLPDQKGSTYKATVLGTLDQRVLQFYDTSGVALGLSTATTWLPAVDGTWDGIMHIEFTDSDGQLHRRQCLEFFTRITSDQPPQKRYYVTIDRPFADPSGSNLVANRMDFRLHQPEFFLRDDVMEMLEPARVFDSTRQQVWGIDTAGAYRQDMVDFRGESTGRPYRMWRGRHFQLPAPTEAPEVAELIGTDAQLTKSGSLSADEEILVWGHGKPSSAYSTGEWGICYTYVMGRRDKEWQQSPMIKPDVLETKNDSQQKVNWAFESYGGSLITGVNAASGVHGPLWESAPSPVAKIKNVVATATQAGKPDESVDSSTTLPAGATRNRALVFAATNIDAQLGFQYQVPVAGSTDASPDFRVGRSGYRIRYYIAHLSSNNDADAYDTETNARFYFLCEVEPTFDQLTGTLYGATAEMLSSTRKKGARIVWNGNQLYDYHRPLRHSTGYYAYKVYPHQDARYELDFRVLRLPRKYVDDQDTAPIQRDAVPALLELSLHYLCLIDGVDQNGAQIHLDRYEELARRYRERYANPGRVVEPVPMFGYSARHRYGTFGSTSE